MRSHFDYILMKKQKQLELFLIIINAMKIFGRNI